VDDQHTALFGFSLDLGTCYGLGVAGIYIKLGNNITGTCGPVALQEKHDTEEITFLDRGFIV
jgi:hypothetical protein